MDVPLGEVIRLIGHDGGAISRPEAPVPDCYQSFHIQELISVAWMLGWSTTPFEPNPTTTIGTGDHHVVRFQPNNNIRMMKLLLGHNGVLTGLTSSGLHHAVAWNSHSKQIYNPNGRIQLIDDFAINTFWILTSMIAQSKTQFAIQSLR